MEIPQKIKDAISSNNLIIFVGSGLSKRFGLPDWKTMVSDIIKEQGDDNDFLDYLPLLNKGKMSPLEVLSKLEDIHGEIRRYIKKKFYLTKGDFSLHKKILDLSSQIVTTNYDNSFEMASGNVILPATHTSDFNVSEVSKTNEPFILKLHGGVQEVDHCIVFKEDYNKLYSEESSIVEKLKSLFINKTILFIGFSFNDEEINLIFEKLNKLFSNYNKHYLLTVDDTNCKDIKFLTQIKLQNFSETETFIENCLRLKEELSGNEQPPLPEKMTPQSRRKLAILTPNPIDKSFNSLLTVRNQFEQLDAIISIGVLNIKTLNEIDDYDLLIIVTEAYKSMIYIETEYLKSDLISPEAIYQAVPNEQIPIVFITNKAIDDFSDYKGVFISSFKNNIINKFIFKSLRNLTFNFQEGEINFTSEDWLLSPIPKGSPQITSIYNIHHKNLSIDKKSITTVIGRIEEQVNLANRLLASIKTNKFLNVKGSGGIGKTTLIKKVASELFFRGYFREGVTFQSCESVRNYEDFEELLIQGFNLLNILQFKEYLIEHHSHIKKDLLIILDNFETVVNTLSNEDYKKAISLLEFCTGFANIALTSRETINPPQDSEDVFSLTPLTTDDALELFIQYYGEVNTDEIKILRADILEDLLNNNPLAIKLVTKSRTRFEHIIELRDQLTNNFFESINEDYNLIFKDNADLNIERTKSIFQSINYSYVTLLQREKLAFELLSLFPDGISLSNFKNCFSKTYSSNAISDKELRVLRDKSLVEDDNGVLKLQPIIRRFADYRFLKRPIDNKRKYWTDAYYFNEFVLEIIDFIGKKRTHSVAYKFYNSMRHNLCKVFEYIKEVDIINKTEESKKLRLIDYFSGIDDWIVNKKQVLEFIDKLDNISTYFADIEHADVFFKVSKYRLTYYHLEFDNSYQKMCEILPVSELETRIIQNEPNIMISYKNSIANFHSMEGHTIKYLKMMVSNNYYKTYMTNDLFYLGIPLTLRNQDMDFYFFEQQLIKGDVNVVKLQEYIDSLYLDEHLEIMQSTYTLSKVNKVSKARIKKLVITNPYTQGIKHLMFAFDANDHAEKISHFEDALIHLKHIKYYYLEGLYYYTKYLFDSGNDYKDKLEEGLNKSTEYFYQYLIFQFQNIIKKEKVSYNLDYSIYPIDGLSDYVKGLINYWEKEFAKNRA